MAGGWWLVAGGWWLVCKQLAIATSCAQNSLTPSSIAEVRSDAMPGAARGPESPEPPRRSLEPRLSRDLQLSVQSLEESLKSGGELAAPSAGSPGERRRHRLLVWAVVLLCITGALQGILVNGLINVVISSIEKRFGIKSSDSGFIANSYDIASFICLLPVSYMVRASTTSTSTTSTTTTTSIRGVGGRGASRRGWGRGRR